MDPLKPTDKEPGHIPSPSCKALLLCDQTIVEAMTGKVSIIGTFERFTIRSAPSHLAPFHVFVQLVEGVGLACSPKVEPVGMRV
jgi:hypothetical protein